MLTKNEEISTFILITTVLILLLIGFILLIFFLYKRNQFGFLTMVASLKNDYEKNLLSAQLEIQEQTLSTLSYEIHDNIMLSLSVAKLSLNTIQWDNTTAIPAKVNDALNQIHKVLDDLRLLTQTMNSSYTTNWGLSKAVELEMEKIDRLKLYRTSFEINDAEVSMDTKKEVIIFRIVQEALHNCIRHANASALSVKMKYTETQLCVQVCDNGTEWKIKKETDTEKLTGFGLTTMEYRAKLLNGTCDVEHIPGEGTTVSLIIPL